MSTLIGNKFQKLAQVTPQIPKLKSTQVKKLVVHTPKPALSVPVPIVPPQPIFNIPFRTQFKETILEAPCTTEKHNCSVTSASQFTTVNVVCLPCVFYNPKGNYQGNA